MEYPFEKIEKKWQDRWEEKEVFYANEDTDKPKYYVLDMFPYPSGSLHMGHVSNYSIGDAIGRFKLMQGYNVMHPIGYDAFGMPAENFAIMHNSHPRLTTEENIKTIGVQFKKMGFGFDWRRELSTCRPDYYHWGQWLFKRIYDKGLAFKKKSFVNWCEACQTVVANEQVVDGKCWRCDDIVVQKELSQWFFKITDYAEELLDFSKVIDWPERVKTMQTNWIGKSYGTQIDFVLDGDSTTKIPVFTTRPDTIYGVTFLALPPEHPLVSNWLAEESDESAMSQFCHKVMNEDKISRSSAETKKEGFFSGRHCYNPLNNTKVAIWITNYVLMDYGTGAVMAVPCHDQRDFEFAKKYKIDFKIVIQNKDNSLKIDTMETAYTDAGIMVNSGHFDGQKNTLAKDKITHYITENKWGLKTVNYRLRDWGISRQRYWGNPIPLIYCPHCGTVPVPDADLPIILPENVQLGKTTQNPLLGATDWINVPCPTCGEMARRETDTMDTFVDSSWYYARYTDAHNDKLPFSKEKVDYWLDVDQYIGGIEHACMHLLYARFFHKFMRDIGMVTSDEPFARLLTQGMVTKDGAKMSKSKGNSVNPLPYIDRYGSDTIRVFMLFASPPEKDVEWSDVGVVGAFRFLNRIWRRFEEHGELIKNNYLPNEAQAELSSEIKKLRYSTHATIKKVVADIGERLQFNTAIAAVMEHLNNIYSVSGVNDLSDNEKRVYAEACADVLRLIYPFAPHICDELWERIGQEKYIHESGVPTHNEAFLVKDEINYVIQIMGKVRGHVIVSPDTFEDDVKKLAVENENVAKHLVDKKIIKIIVIKNKLVNIVAK